MYLSIIFSIYNMLLPLSLLSFSNILHSNSTSENKTTCIQTPLRCTLYYTPARKEKPFQNGCRRLLCKFNMLGTFLIHSLTQFMQIEAIFRTVGSCLMAIVNGIGAVLQAIIGAIVGLFDIVISCLTCGGGRGRGMGRRHHTRHHMTTRV